MTRPNKGDEYELTIESLAFGGKGVAHLDRRGFSRFWRNRPSQSRRRVSTFLLAADVPFNTSITTFR